MKQLKLMLLMAFFSLGFSSISFGQMTAPLNTKAVTRNACLSGYSGCYNGPVTLAITSVYGSSTYTFPAATTKTNMYNKYGKQITVTIAGLTSIGNYTLPVNVGDQIIITDGLDDGVHHAYTVGITKTGNNQYSLSVGDYAY